MIDNDPQDKELAALYRASALEMPSDGLDARILAAARSVAPTAKLKPVTWSQRWRTPIAVAATLVVTATLTLLVQDEQNGRLAETDKRAVAERAPSAAPVPGTQSSGPAASALPGEPAAPAAPTASTAPARSIESAKVTQTEGRLKQDATPFPETTPRSLERRQEGQAAQAPAAAVQAPVLQDRPLSNSSLASEARKAAPDTTSRNEARVDAQPAPPRPAAITLPSSSREAGATIGIRGTNLGKPEQEPETRERRDAVLAPAMPATPAPAPAMAAKPAAAAAPPARAAAAPQRAEESASTDAKDRIARTPTQWIAEIRKLRQEGRITEAERSLAEFRKSYPWYALPEDLQPRPAAVEK